MTFVGWICPRCEAVNAPHVERCNCAPAPYWAPTTVPQIVSPCARCGRVGCTGPDSTGCAPLPPDTVTVLQDP